MDITAFGFHHVARLLVSKEVLRKKSNAPAHLRGDVWPGLQQWILAGRVRLQRAHHSRPGGGKTRGVWWPTATLHGR